MTWRAILDEETARDALAVVEEVASALRDPPPAFAPAASPALWRRTVEASLADGKAGLALLHHYVDRAWPGRGSAAVRDRLLDESVAAVETVPMGIGLYQGFVGQAWATLHLGTGGDDPNADVDRALLTLLAEPAWEGKYDLIGGLAGLGVYALERGPAGRSILEGVVRHLDDLAEWDGEWAAWRTRPGDMRPDQLPEYPSGWFNLGMAHGAPGPIAVLASAVRAGVEADRAARLVSGAVDRLLARRRRGTISAFANPHPAGPRPQTSRLAWCYGDPGVAVALLSAGRCLGEPAWERSAVEIAVASARRPPGHAGVVDACLCHGSAGLAHLFDRLHQATGEEPLLEAARRWYRATLDARRPGAGIAGFETSAGDPDRPERVVDPGFLTGAAGIALALLSASRPIEPAWDRLLLAEVPPA